MAIRNVPSWYLPNTKGSTAFSSLQNALLPYMDNPSQIAASANLSSGDPTFVSYEPYNLPKPPSTVPERKKQYLSRERAERSLSAINRMMSISGITTETPGIRYLKDTINTLRQYGAPGGAMSRKQYLDFTKAMSAMRNSQAAQDAEEYATLANYATGMDEQEAPITTRTVSGKTVFGTPNKKLFG